MARGESGRIVLEIDPSQKDELYSALEKEGMTLKDWFLKQASRYLKDASQLTFFESSRLAEEPAIYGAKPIDTNGAEKKTEQPASKTKKT